MLYPDNFQETSIPHCVLLKWYRIDQDPVTHPDKNKSHITHTSTDVMQCINLSVHKQGILKHSHYRYIDGKEDSCKSWGHEE